MVPQHCETDAPAQVPDPAALGTEITAIAQRLGFAAIGVAAARIPDEHRAHLRRWLAQGSHGSMRWMADRAALRENPAQLVPDALSVLSVRMDYLPPDTEDPWQILGNRQLAYVSRYALGRDYHKLIRKRLQALAEAIDARIGPFGYRAFTDSAPILEKALAQQAGLGWIGKHTNLLSREGGSWFFLGELLTTLPPDAFGQPNSGPPANHCGRCTACLDICPTQAFRGPYDLDARRCVSYLTIEHDGAIPLELRSAIGNRIYGCDDCQLVCPWNRFARLSVEPDFAARHRLDAASITELLDWNEATFLERTAGMAIRRIGFERWQRNLAVAAGNALAPQAPSARPDAVRATGSEPTSEPAQNGVHNALKNALLRARSDASELVREHIDWALHQDRP